MTINNNNKTKTEKLVRYMKLRSKVERVEWYKWKMMN